MSHPTNFSSQFNSDNTDAPYAWFKFRNQDGSYYNMRHDDPNIANNKDTFINALGYSPNQTVSVFDTRGISGIKESWIINKVSSLFTMVIEVVRPLHDDDTIYKNAFAVALDKNGIKYQMDVQYNDTNSPYVKPIVVDFVINNEVAFFINPMRSRDINKRTLLDRMLAKQSIHQNKYFITADITRHNGQYRVFYKDSSKLHLDHILKYNDPEIHIDPSTQEIVDVVIDTANIVRSKGGLGWGHEQDRYQFALYSALAQRLGENKVRENELVDVTYSSQKVGEFLTGIIVCDTLVVQVIRNYCAREEDMCSLIRAVDATGLPGLIINFVNDYEYGVQVISNRSRLSDTMNETSEVNPTLKNTPKVNNSAYNHVNNFQQKDGGQRRMNNRQRNFSN